VIDNSVVPKIVSSNPTATIYALAEKFATHVREDYQGEPKIPLVLTSVCNGIWRVENANDEEFTFRWRAEFSEKKGVFSAPARCGLRSDQRGVAIFHTPKHETVTISLNGVDYSTVETNYLPCNDEEAGVPAITRFILFDSTTNQDIQVIREGDVISLSSVGTNLNVRAEVVPIVKTDKVKFKLNGHPQGTQFVEPFDLFTVKWWPTPTPGTYTIEATPFTGVLIGTEGDSLEVTFEFVA